MVHDIDELLVDPNTIQNHNKNWLLVPQRTPNSNEIQILIFGPPNSNFSFIDNSSPKTYTTNDNGYFIIKFSLKEKEERQIVILVTGMKPFKRIFKGYAFSTPSFPTEVAVTSLIFFSFIWGWILFSSDKNTSITWTIWIHVVLFCVYCFIATKTSLSKIMYINLLLFFSVSVATCIDRPFGEPIFDMINNFLFEHSKSLRQNAWILPEEYSGNGTWLWFIIAITFFIEVVIFLPFAFWNDFVEAYRMVNMKWELRSFNTQLEEANTVSTKYGHIISPNSRNIFSSKIVDAVLFVVLYETIKTFLELLIRKINR